MPIAAYAGPGDLDPTFSGDGLLTDGEGRASDVAIQPDGKIVVVTGLVIARYDPDGTRDTSFGGGTGRVTVNFGLAGETYIRGFAIQPDGKIAVGGVVGTGAVYFGVVRFDPDGSPDLSFGGGTGRVLTAVSCGNFNENFGAGFELQPDGKMVGGVRFDYCNGQLLRYRSDGSIDPSFGSNGTGTTAADVFGQIAIQSNGKIVVVGSQRLLRFETNGSPDLGFNAGFHGLVYSVAIQPDNKIVTCGAINNGSNADFRVVRYNGDGSPDTSFDGDGSVATPIGPGGDVATSVAIQTDGRIVAAGVSDSGLNVTDFALVRYNVDGSLDSTFGGGDGITTTDFDNSWDGASALALDTTGRVVVVGESYFNSIPRLAIARFHLGILSAPFDFAGDGRTDISVFRPSEGKWYLNQSTDGIKVVWWGLAGDKIVPGDYDGDGKTDTAVFRPSVNGDRYGNWYIINSATNTFAVQEWGEHGAMPVPGDYDGDGQTDRAVLLQWEDDFGGWHFQWYVLKSSGGVLQSEFGQEYGIPVPQDYDGDGLTDRAIYSAGTWQISKTDGSPRTENWGLPGDIPVPADYDGDGTADIAVFRPSEGRWYIRHLNGNINVIEWGLAGDVPVPGDYDGDGKTDPAVYRNGAWYLLQTTSGISVRNWGLANDRPVPAAYLH